MIDRAPRNSAVVAGSLACLALVGWLVKLPILTSLSPGAASMKPNTALALIAAAISLGLLARRGASRRASAAALALASLVAGFGVLSLIEILTGRDLGIDGWPMASSPLTGSAAHPLLMSPATAILLIGLGLALWLLALGCGALAQFVGLGVTLVSFFSLVAFGYGPETLVTFRPFATLSLPTTLATLALGLGLALASPSRGLVAVVLAPTFGGAAARRLLPFAITVPILLGWLQLEGEKRGFFDDAAGSALFVSAKVVVVCAVVLWTAWSLSRLDRQRQESEVAFREIENRFQLLAEELPLVVAVATAADQIQYLNPYLRHFLGLPAEVDLAAAWVGAIHPDDVTPTMQAWHAAVATGKTYEGEYRLRRADGEYRWFMVRSVPLTAPSQAGQWVSIATDVHDLKMAEAKARRYAHQLERSNWELERFAYVASHDLQEPLRTLAGFSELLTERYRGRLGGEGEEFLGFIEGGALRMQTMVQDLLSYSRVGTHGEPFVAVDCSELVDEVSADLGAAIEECGARLSHQGLPTVEADRGQLRQVFSNLIGNAIKYRRPGVPPEVRVSAERVSGAWQFSVEDNGIGIEPKYFDRIFIAFQRLHGRDEYPGTGIGLAITQRVVERHGGRIGLESRLGEGSTFRFTIPDSKELTS